MFNNSNGNRMNNGSDLNVNTNLRTSNSDTSSLNIALWNQYISLRISPAIGVDGNGVTQYDKTRKGNTALSAECCELLAKEFEAKLLPAYTNAVFNGIPLPEEVMSVTTETGRDPKRNIVGIEMRSAVDGSNVPDLFFVIYNMVDMNNVAVEANTFRHKFPKKICRVGYNPVTGISAQEYMDNSDFNLFINMLGHSELMLPYSEHNKKYITERAKMFGGNNNSNGNSYGGNAYGANNYGGNSYGGNRSGGNTAAFASSGPTAFEGVGFSSMGLADELPFN